ncbi:MAG TPA: arsenate reductase ArsC [Gemmatimonadales bacterium]
MLLLNAPLRILVLCTGNSARSQMAEALFNSMGKGRIVAESAGSQPAGDVNPLAISTLIEHGLMWSRHPPRSLDGLEKQAWDFVITVCDNARESCPVFSARTATAHWGMRDPAEETGSDDKKRAAFNDAYVLLRRRIELMLALPIERLKRATREAKVRAIPGQK